MRGRITFTCKTLVKKPLNIGDAFEAHYTTDINILLWDHISIGLTHDSATVDELIILVKVLIPLFSTYFNWNASCNAFYKRWLLQSRLPFWLTKNTYCKIKLYCGPLLMIWALPLLTKDLSTLSLSIIEFLKLQSLIE